MLEVSDEKVVVGNERSCLHDAVVCLWQRFSPYALALILFMVPHTAYAEPTIEVNGNYAGTENGVTYKGYVVVNANSAYKATLTLIEQYFQLVEITTDMYNELMTESTGGRFYELVQLWEVCGTSANGREQNYPNWISMTDYYIDGLNTVYGYGNVWECVCTDDLISGARQDLVTILEGGDLSGGGSSGGGASTDNLTQTIVLDQYKDYGIVHPSSSYWGIEELSGTFTLNISSTLLANIKQYQYCRIYYYYLLNTAKGVGGGWYAIVCSDSEISETVEELDANTTYNIDRYAITVTSESDMYILNNYLDEYLPTRNATVSASNLTNRGESYKLSLYTGNTFGWIGYFSNYIENSGGGGGSGGGGSNEPTPEPDPPEPDPPVNPRVPSPREPVPPDPPDDPDLPDPDPIPDPPQGPTVDDPTPPTVDDDDNFTYDFQGLIDALNEHCIHIQTNLNANFSAIRTYFSSKLTGEFSANRGYMQTVGDAIIEQIGNIGDYMVEAINLHVDYAIDSVEQCFGDLIDYFEETTKWLDKKLDYKFPDNSYDDTSLLYWLKRIYAKLGSGTVGTKPIDPVEDTQGTLEWLLSLLQNLLGDVADKVVGALGMAEMLSAMGELTSYFPISIPWDMYAVVDLLDAEPVTPVFDLAMPTGFDGETVTVHVDLSPWDDVAAICRQGSVILFAVGLMWRVRSMIETAVKVTG